MLDFSKSEKYQQKGYTIKDIIRREIINTSFINKQFGKLLWIVNFSAEPSKFCCFK